MTRLLLLAMPGNESITAALADRLAADVAALETRQFPDGETYLRIATDVRDRTVIIVATLAHPNDKFLPLVFAANTAHQLGAAKVGLVAPYLAYMRQDRRFQPGEAVTSRSVARLLSANFDWLVTIDPHLHRYKSLSDIYSIRTRVLHAAPLMSQWIAQNVDDPILIGPDSESTQWVSDVARDLGAPSTVLEKTRRGDRDVDVRVKDAQSLGSRTPVLVDDIISSGQTMLQAVKLLRTMTTKTPVCVAVHGIFAEHADLALHAAGAKLVTSNTVPHATNALDVSELLAAGIASLG